MPLADYTCRCGRVDEDVPFRLALGAISDAPDCPDCGARMDWIPQAAFDVRSDGEGGKGFQKFSVDVDGRPVEIDSLHTLRRVERESEQRFRNGEGEPLRFRGYSQDHSNIDRSSFEAHGVIGTREYSSGVQPTKRMPVRKHADEPTVATGPGVAPDGVTALKD